MRLHAYSDHDNRAIKLKWHDFEQEFCQWNSSNRSPLNINSRLNHFVILKISMISKPGPHGNLCKKLIPCHLQNSDLLPLLSSFIIRLKYHSSFQHILICSIPHIFPEISAKKQIKCIRSVHAW